MKILINNNTFYILNLILEDVGAIMQEVLYNIEIKRDESKFLGKIYSEIDGVKEFKNEHIDRLLSDMTVDMQLALDEFSNHSSNFEENIDEIFL